MIAASIIILGVSAVLGLILATVIFLNRETPKGIVLTHGTFSVTGLVLLIIYILENPDQYLRVSLLIFAIAVVGGFYLFYNDIKKKKPGPKAVVVIHGIAAVAAFALLLLFVMK